MHVCMYMRRATECVDPTRDGGGGGGGAASGSGASGRLEYRLANAPG